MIVEENIGLIEISNEDAKNYFKGRNTFTYQEYLAFVEWKKSNLKDGEKLSLYYHFSL